MVTTDLTDGKRWATDWLFGRTLQDLDSLLDLMFGEEGYEKLKKARQLVINEAAGRFSNGATPKMDVQLPGVGFERYDREPDDAAFVDDAVVCQGCGITDATEPVRFWLALNQTYCNACALEAAITPPAIPTPTAEGPVSKGATISEILVEQDKARKRINAIALKVRESSSSIPPTTSESSLPHWGEVFPEWMTPEDEAAYEGLQDEVVERQVAIAREASVKYSPAMKELATEETLSPELEAAFTALGEAAGQRWAEEHNRGIEENGIFLEPDKGGLKILIGWKNGPMDFTGRWKTREGCIADVGAQNRDDWNEEGRHRHDTNLDLMERLRDGGNRIFEPTRKDVLTELAAYDQELDI